MRVGRTTLGSLVLLVGSGCPTEADPSGNPICWKEPRIYHPGGANAAELETTAKRLLRFSHRTGALPHPRTLSPNGAYALHYSEQHDPEAPSRANSVSLLVFNEKSELLSLQADGVFSLVDLLWLGRLAGVDVLWDVEEEAVIRIEGVADGRILWEQARESCHALPHVPACNEACTTLK